MRRSLCLAALTLLLIFAPLAARAADPLPGDACSIDGEIVRTGGSETNGVGHFLICVSGIRAPFLSFDGGAQVTRIGNQTCNTGEVLKFDGAKWACAADADTADNLGDHIATQALDMATFTVTNVADPSAAQDAVIKAYVDGLTGANETDPQVGTLTSSKWCASNAGGTAIDCTQNPPGGGGGTVPTVQRFLSSGTWTKPANLSYVKVWVVAGGGGAGNNTTAGTAGGASSFGAFLSANGGGGGGSSNNAGGTGQGGTGGDIVLNGQTGSNGGNGGGGGVAAMEIHTGRLAGGHRGGDRRRWRHFPRLFWNCDG